MPTLHALLIGIDDYDDRWRNNVRYRKLNGCVRDVERVRAYLRDDLQVAPACIQVLAAPRRPTEACSGAPLPAPDAWPTKPAIAAAFHRLHNRAQPGDQAYIHYSGHGGRAATVYPHLEGKGHWDECLVPVDIGSEAGEYLRDVEIYGLIRALVDKEVLVTVVLDSCHSGGATRDDTPAVARAPETAGGAQGDVGPRPHTDALAGAETFWVASAPAARTLAPESPWRFEVSGYTFIAACRATESAFEYTVDGVGQTGALTHFLLETLRLAGRTTTWQTVMGRVGGQVRARFESQTPHPQGDLGRLPFGAAWRSSPSGIKVLAVAPDGTSVRLQAGRAHGIERGARAGIFPFDADRMDPSAAIAEVVVTDVEAAVCTGDVLRRTATVAPGQGAMLWGAPRVRVQLLVSVGIDDPALRAQVERAIDEHGEGFLLRDPVAQEVDARVLLSGDGLAFLLCDPTDTPLPGLAPLPAAAPGAAQTIARQLAHMARFTSVNEIAAPVGPSDISIDVRLEQADGSDAMTVAGVRPGDRVRLRVTNRCALNPTDPALGALNITILDLASDWSISRIYPQYASFALLPADESLLLEFEAYLPTGSAAVAETLKVFATVAATDFDWMEMGPLGAAWQPKDTRTRGDDDLLGALFDQWSAVPCLRGVRPVTRPGHEWTVAEVKLRVAERAPVAGAG